MGRKVHAWAAMDSSGRLSPYSFHLRETGPYYMLLRVLYCGVDHTDLHQIKGELTSSTTKYPLVPGYVLLHVYFIWCMNLLPSSTPTRTNLVRFLCYNRTLQFLLFSKENILLNKHMWIQSRSYIYTFMDDIVSLSHEVVGEVAELGVEVKTFKLGDIVGAGGIIESCGECNLCNSNLEQYCNHRIWAYNDVYKDGTPTYGGFSSFISINQRFAVKIPLKLAPEQATPLLCAGVTAYSPLKQFMGSEMVFKGGILGLGGVGHLGVMIAKAMGHHVTVISSSDKKKEEALQHLSADHFLLSTSEAEMKRAANSLDYILDTVPAFHPLESYLALLKPEGKLLIVGAVPQRLQFFASELITGKKAIMGSLLGSIKETEELLNFWVEKGLTTMIEVVKMEYVNEAFERMEKNDVRYRFVLDVAGSNPE